MTETLIVNLFGGPGTGKSTTCAGVFSALKLMDVNCEMATEFAKDKVWEGSPQLLYNQPYIFGEQYHRIWRLLGKVSVVLTDAPLLNSILYYQGENLHFPAMVASEHGKLRNLNILLGREKNYNPAGRVQDEKQAKGLDSRIREILDFLEEPYIEIKANKHAIPKIVSHIAYGGLSSPTVEYLKQFMKKEAT